MKRGAIYQFNCDLDGKTNTDATKPKHYFVVLSDETYNERGNSFLCVGTSSNTSQHYSVQFIMEDFENWSEAMNHKESERNRYEPFEKLSQVYILIDKVCRVRQEDILFRGHGLDKPLMLRPEKYKQLIERIRDFMYLDS